MQKDCYALELSRYIHLNPVRAYLVGDPSKYPWSNYSVYVGKGKGWDWLEKRFVLRQVSSEERRAQRGYERYTNEEVKMDVGNPLEKVVGSTVLGSDGFIEWVRERWVGKRSSNRDVPPLKRITKGPDLPLILKETERVFGRGRSETTLRGPPSESTYLMLR